MSPERWPIVAFRIALFLIWLSLALAAYFALRPFTRPNPVPSRFLGGTARIAGARVKTTGTLPAGPAFFIANHVSWIDILAIAGATGSAFVAHDGLAAFGPLRWLCRMNDTVFVSRHDRRGVSGQIDDVRAALADTGALTLFPEGTTGPGEPLLPFKSSLVSALTPLPEGVSVVPLWIDYGTERADIAWVGEEPGLANVLRILARRRRLDVTLHVLPPIAPEALATRKSITIAARQAIEAAQSASERP
ncbi:1-acyl-sn-glycerol-3-phosphate acyltransferase [Novosphingobium sp. PC22D]|nr:1-acyl-sn-glycerol-3-phosphate acyltransferase [Novosphingobium sp. PC22D]